MPFSHALKLPEGPDADTPHTVIFIDVDGVLNIGARDAAGGAPFLFSDTSVEQAWRFAKSKGPQAKLECVQKLVAIDKRKLGPGEEGTLGKFASTSPCDVSPILTERLAQLIRAAGTNRTVVLCSSWRRPQHRLRMAWLEQEISRHLGTDFAFDERTPLRDDSVAEERVRCIGDFLESLRVLPKGGLQLLVLEDFFITPLKGWSCDGVEVKNTEVIEQYLLRRLPASASAVARVVHTFDEWKTPNGLEVQAGIGLTMENLTKAMDFLNGGDTSCGSTLASSVISSDSEEAPPRRVYVNARTGSKEQLAKETASKKPWEEVCTPSERARRSWLERLSATLPRLSVTSRRSL